MYQTVLYLVLLFTTLNLVLHEQVIILPCALPQGDKVSAALDLPVSVATPSLELYFMENWLLMKEFGSGFVQTF